MKRQKPRARPARARGSESLHLAAKGAQAAATRSDSKADPASDSEVSCVEEGIGYRGLRSLLEAEHGAAAANGTTGRVLQALHRGAGATSRQVRRASEFERKPIVELQAYDDWEL